MAQSSALSRHTMAKSVADRLRDEILRAQLSPGTRLMQSEIAERFGVSTTPVREALTKLEGEGLIVIDQHKGAVVFRPTMKDFRECFEIRELLETFAMAKAMPNLDEEVLSRLAELVQAMETTADRAHWVQLNNSFHLAIYAASNQPRLIKLIAGLRDASAAYLHMFATARMHEAESIHLEHRQILEACRSGDVAAGVAAVQEHLRRPIADVASATDETGEFVLEDLLHRATQSKAGDD